MATNQKGIGEESLSNKIKKIYCEKISNGVLKVTSVE